MKAKPAATRPPRDPPDAPAEASDDAPDDAADDTRARRRTAAMLRVQAAALTAFEARGYERVSIDEIARAADVGPATVYRHFGTKERIVLWDEYDPALLGELDRALAERERDVASATLLALGRALAQHYARDKDRIFRRARLVRATPLLQQAVAADLQALRGAIAALLGQRRRAKDALAARVLAGALVAAIEAGIDTWLDEDGRLPLERCLRMAFARLQPLAGGATGG
ncbi:MAG: TetR family transcriptional regulator [Myxococcota bacterium]